MDDVVIAGAGPAGAFAAAILARSGWRVRLFDRARFPRHKLCGDTLNPGAVAILRDHFDVSPLIAMSDPIRGMLLTGPGGVQVRGEYGGGLAGRAVTRWVLDQWLIERAIESGAVLEDGVTVRDVVIGDAGVIGVKADGPSGSARAHPTRLVIAADGRRSALAIGRGLSSQPARPRRWAIGAYYSGVAGTSSMGEMHIRRGHYIGVAPVPQGLTNACLVISHSRGDLPLARPADALTSYLTSDPQLAPRFAGARITSPPVMLGPMAVDSAAAGAPGLLLAGDAAGFIDPMTGDGLRFALLGAQLAATVARAVLEGQESFADAHVTLARRRRRAFASKWRFNRTLRSLVASPASVTAAAVTARVWPSMFAQMIRFAGDCPQMKHRLDTDIDYVTL